MTPEAQRIAIAETCGYSVAAANVSTRSNAAKTHYLDALYIPNYLNDLNAMHEAEKSLTVEQERLYIMHLLGIDGKDNPRLWNLSWDSAFYCAAALPERRAEAFLKTLGKWTDATTE